MSENKVPFDPSELQDVGEFIKSGRRWELKVSEIQNREIVILDFEDIETKFGAAYLCSVWIDGEEKSLLCGGQVLMSQLDEVKEHLPLKATIIKPGRSYVFSSPNE